MGWLSSLGPSVLIIIGGIISWFLKSKSEHLRAIEESLRAERRRIYVDMLEPHIRIFADIRGKGPAKAI